MSCAECHVGRVIEMEGHYVCTSCGVVDTATIIEYLAPFQSPRPVTKRPKCGTPRWLRRAQLEDADRQCKACQELHNVGRHILHMQEPTVAFAVEIYEDVKSRRARSLRGDFKRAVMANCVLLAGKSVDQKKVQSAFGVTCKTIGNARKLMRTELMDQPYFVKAFSSASVSDVVHHFLNGKGIVDRIKRQAVIKAVESAEQRVRSATVADSKSPMSLAAGILKHVLEGTVDTEDIAHLCGISAHTVNTTYKSVREVLELPELSSDGRSPLEATPASER